MISLFVNWYNKIDTFKHVENKLHVYNKRSYFSAYMRNIFFEKNVLMLDAKFTKNLLVDARNVSQIAHLE